METVILILILWASLFGFTTGIIANSKGRDGIMWGLLGATIGVFALVLVCALPPLPERKPYVNTDEVPVLFKDESL